MKKIFAIAIAAFFAVSANAQDCCKSNEAKQCCGGFNPSWFVNFQSGVNVPYTSGDKSDLLSPAFSINVGRNITPLVSTRLSLEGTNSKVFNQYTGAKESFKYATGTFDAMLDVVSIFNKKCHPVNFYVLAGVGANWSGMKTTNSSHFSPAVRLGAQLNYRVAKNLALNLEYRANSTNDQFNGRLKNGSHDWYSNVFFGLSLVLPDARPAKDYSGDIAALNARINELIAENEELKARKPEVVEVVKEVVKETPVLQALLPNVFFNCSQSKITAQQQANVKMIADYMNANPNAKLTINGYASVDGNAKFNSKLAEARAKAVAKMLVSKYGISESRLTVVNGGATSSIYPQKNLNRVAVSVAE